MNLNHLFTIVQAFANNCFIPESNDGNYTWHDHILPALLSNEHLNHVSATSYIWLPFTLQLMILGHCDPKRILHVLSSPYLEEYLNRKNLSALDLSKILILYQTASMQPNVDLSSIDKNSIDNLLVKYKSNVPPCNIQMHLSEYFDKNFVLTDVRTKFAHWIPTLMKIDKKTLDFLSFSDGLGRDQHGFIPLDSIPCKENEIL